MRGPFEGVLGQRALSIRRRSPLRAPRELRARRRSTPLALAPGGPQSSWADLILPIDKHQWVVQRVTCIHTSVEVEVNEIEVRELVRAKYAQSALEMAKGASCCDDSCCDANGCGDGYAADELASVGLDAAVSLGCGNPILLADLRPGEVVLDLGSGAGLDVLLSARRVAPGGHAYGVDMTDEMLAVARANQAKSGLGNATFLKGAIESVPLPDASVDVVISNCVINLAADKGAVLREAFRVLRPDGRFAVADMIALDELAPEAKQRLDLWAGCVAGTISLDAYTKELQAAGFDAIDIEVTREVRLEDVEGLIASAYIRARRPSRVEIAAKAPASVRLATAGQADGRSSADRRDRARARRSMRPVRSSRSACQAGQPTPIAPQRAERDTPCSARDVRQRARSPRRAPPREAHEGLDRCR